MLAMSKAVLDSANRALCYTLGSVRAPPSRLVRHAHLRTLQEEAEP
jgi:hypothetical protein